MTTSLSSFTLPDQSIQLTDLQHFQSLLRINHDICLVGLGVRWNYSSWQSWNHVWKLQNVARIMKQQNQTGSNIKDKLVQDLQKDGISTSLLSQRQVGIILLDEEEAVCASKFKSM